MSLVARKYFSPPVRSVRSLALAGLVLATAASPLRTQTTRQATSPAIGAASVRWLCTGQACRAFPNGFAEGPKYFACDNCNMFELLGMAYPYKSFKQILNAPMWFGNDYYQVHIEAAAPVASTAQMHQALLKEVLVRCFGLNVHAVDRDVPGYALVVADGGIKFRRIATAVPPVSDGVLHFDNLTNLAAWLTGFYYDNKSYGVTRPVRDATGLSGVYDIPVAMPQRGSGTNLLAVVGRLGIRFKPAPGAATVFDVSSVDHLTKSCFVPPPNGDTRPGR